LQLLTFLALVVAVFSGRSQTAAQPPVDEPQYVNSFYMVDQAGKLIDLEHQTVTNFHAKTKALPGYASVKMLAEFKPSHSSVRIPATAQFVIRGRSQVDPSSIYELRLLKSAKDHREILISTGKGTLVGARSTSNVDDDAIPIRFEEYGEASYRITPQQPLRAGEYALSIRGAITELYCFGVDK
jgi:hypothetical protein